MLVIKRLFDLSASFAGLLLLLPIFICLAIWIKKDATGPVFYRQERVGRLGKIFKIFKFRSMYVGSDKSGLITVGLDSRITPSGHFIRKTKLDELPQLLNVLLGDMSLVGPRPEVQEFIDEYPEDVRTKVLSVRPGITDEASIEMVDENEVLAQYTDSRKAYIEVILPIKQAYYLKYVDDNSFFYDLKLIITTLKKILER